MLLEIVGGRKDGRILDIGEEEMSTQVLTVSYKTDDEIYIARKFQGKMVLFYFGKREDK